MNFDDISRLFAHFSVLHPAMASRKTSSAQVELVLLPGLRNCLLNLPASLVAVLLNSNTVAQNVVVEISYRSAAAASTGTDPKQRAPAISKSVFLGWTGYQSQTKMASIVGRDGLASARAGGRQEQEVPTVEIDATFGRLLGLSEGIKVRRRPFGLSWLSTLIRAQ